MTFLPVQIIFATFLIFAITRVLLRLKDGALAFNAFFFWLVVFILSLVGVIRPELTSVVANWLGINRGSDVVVYASILLIFYLIFRTNILLENLRHDLTRLVRQLALKDETKKKK
ncbi:DUF2304 domain-containing protein [Patescibacteria group bacterium]